VSAGVLVAIRLNPQHNTTQQQLSLTGLFFRLLGTRDSSLSLFHALGKVLYNKRLEDKHSAPRSEFHRPPLSFDPENVLKQVQSTPADFNMFLHENYLSFFHSLDECASALQYLSDADLIDSQLQYPYRVSGGFFSNYFVRTDP
jgi:hypothetical protein